MLWYLDDEFLSNRNGMPIYHKIDEDCRIEMQSRGDRKPVFSITQSNHDAELSYVIPGDEILTKIITRTSPNPSPEDLHNLLLQEELKDHLDSHPSAWELILQKKHSQTNYNSIYRSPTMRETLPFGGDCDQYYYAKSMGHKL